MGTAQSNYPGSPAILGSSRRSNVAEDTRTRGFASLTFVRFAFTNRNFCRVGKPCQFWDIRNLGRELMRKTRGCLLVQERD